MSALPGGFKPSERRFFPNTPLYLKRLPAYFPKFDLEFFLGPPTFFLSSGRFVFNAFL